MSIIVGLFLLLALLVIVLPVPSQPIPIRVAMILLWFALFVMEKQGLLLHTR